eukprot:scaffold322_cov109-Isochrysis_galbana.AAC.2
MSNFKSPLLSVARFWIGKSGELEGPCDPLNSRCGTPRPNWPAVVRRGAHSRKAAMASGRVAARRRMLGIPMGRTPKSSEGGTGCHLGRA